MKFETWVKKIVKSNQNNFRKDLCTHTRARGVNVLAHVSSRVARGNISSRAGTFTSCVHACVHRSLRKFFWLLFTIFLTQVQNFIKIKAFVTEILAKQYRRFYVYKLSILYPFLGVIFDYFWVVFWSKFFWGWISKLS